MLSSWLCVICCMFHSWHRLSTIGFCLHFSLCSCYFIAATVWISYRALMFCICMLSGTKSHRLCLSTAPPLSHHFASKKLLSPFTPRYISPLALQFQVMRSFLCAVSYYARLSIQEAKNLFIAAYRKMSKITRLNKQNRARRQQKANETR